jgi:hypothetical protein
MGAGGGCWWWREAGGGAMVVGEMMGGVTRFCDWLLFMDRLSSNMRCDLFRLHQIV